MSDPNATAPLPDPEHSKDHSNEATAGPTISPASEASHQRFQHVVEQQASSIEQRTQTFQPPPTHVPDHSHHKALSDETERMDCETPDTLRLPKIPGFHIEKIIGRGGMGKVFQAVDLKLGRTVALKLITMTGRDELAVQQRFEREVQTLALIKHANIVPIHHAGEWQGFPYFTMEWIPAGALSQHLNRFKDNPEKCAGLLIKVARAIHALHQAGVIHRDLKPLNILLADNDEPLVADFGLARWLDSSPSDITVTHIPIGTRPYMSPEQTWGQKAYYAEPCDIWALGVILYELLTGTKPFQEDHSNDLFDQIRMADPPPLPSSIPSALVAIIHKCLAKNPENRYPSAAAVADDLERWLRGQPVSVSLKATSRIPVTSSRSSWPLVLALAGLLALIAIPAIVMTRKKAEFTPKTTTIAERLRAGEKVVLIGEKGVPPSNSRQLPQCDGTIVKSQSGYSMLSSPTFAAVELSGEELPWPIKLRVEFAYELSQGVSSWGGVYVGGKEMVTNRPCQSIFALTHHTMSMKQDSTEWDIQEQAGFELAIWDINPPGTRVALPTTTPHSLRLPRTADLPLRWQSFQIIIRPESLFALWNELKVPPVFTQKSIVATLVHSTFTDWQPRSPDTIAPRFTQPYIGPGIGLCVFNAGIVYRNFTLESVSQAP